MSHSGKALIDPYPIFERIALGQKMHVADFGSGQTGHFVFPASRIVGESGVVYAVEILPETVLSIKSRARSEGYHNVQVVWSNIERVGQTPIPESSLDVCFIVNVLFMLPDRVAAITEAVRLLKPGGWLVIVEWSKKLGAVGPTFTQMVNQRMIETWMGAQPVKAVDNFPAGEYHYCALFKKNS